MRQSNSTFLVKHAPENWENWTGQDTFPEWAQHKFWIRIYLDGYLKKNNLTFKKKKCHYPGTWCVPGTQHTRGAEEL